MAKFLGGLKVFLGLDSSNFDKGLSKARKGVDTFKNYALKAAGAVGIAFSFSAAIQGLNKFYDKLDLIGKRSSALGVTAEYYQKMEYAAERSGIAVEKVYDSMNRLVKFAGDFANGNAEAGKVFAALGLTREDIKGLSPDKLLELVNRQLAMIPDNQQRVALGARLMGESYGKLTNYLRDFSALSDEASAKGFIIDNAQVKEAEALKDVFTDVNRSFTQIAASLLKVTNATGILAAAAEEFAALAGGEEAARRGAGIFSRDEVVADVQRRIAANAELKEQFDLYMRFNKHPNNVALEEFGVAYGMYNRSKSKFGKVWYSSKPTQAEIKQMQAERDRAKQESIQRAKRAEEERKRQAESDLKAYAQSFIDAKKEEALPAKERALRKALREFDNKAAALGVSDPELRAQIAAAAVSGFEDTVAPAANDDTLAAARARSDAILSRFNSPQRAGTVLAGSMEAYKAQFNNENNLLRSMEQTARKALIAQQQTAQNTAALQGGTPVVVGVNLQGE